ncbi:MAG: hypothetical protein NTV97_14855 [Alphaproteobacteria bacterium]|nr:hypothetical protein [Alphaproteobacteria bacterium]
MAETSDGEKLHRDGPLHSGRGAFIVVVIAMLLCPVSAGIGYYLNQFLQRPDLQIAQVDQIFVVESHVFNDAVFRALDRDEDAVASYRDNLERLAAPAVCIEWLDGAGWNDDCLPTMQQITNGLIGGRKASIKTVLNNIKTKRRRRSISSRRARYRPRGCRTRRSATSRRRSIPCAARSCRRRRSCESSSRSPSS